MASSKDLGDIGNPAECPNILGAEYVSLDINLNILPVNIILGFCMPSSCKVSLLETAATRINVALYKAIQDVNIPYLNAFNFTPIMFFENSKNY